MHVYFSYLVNIFFYPLFRVDVYTAPKCVPTEYLPKYLILENLFIHKYYIVIIEMVIEMSIDTRLPNISMLIPIS